METEEDFIKRMEDEYFSQTRNGRDDVYIDADDLNRMGYGIDENKKGRTFVDAAYFKIRLNRMKFKDSIKVDIKPEKTYKDLEKEIKIIERGERDV